MSRSIEHFVEEFPEVILGVTYLRKKLHINWIGGVLAITAYNSQEGIYQHRLHLNGQQVVVEGTVEQVVSELQKIQDHMINLWTPVDTKETFYHIVTQPTADQNKLFYLGAFTEYQMIHKASLLEKSSKCNRYYVFMCQQEDQINPVSRNMFAQTQNFVKMGYVHKPIYDENDLQLWIKGEL